MWEFSKDLTDDMLINETGAPFFVNCTIDTKVKGY